MKKIKLLSAFLAVVMVLGMLPVLAAEPLVPGYDEEEGIPTIDYVKQVFKTPEDKLATMTKYLEKEDMSLYIEPISGEVAYVNNKTGQILFSNPYDVASTATTKDTKQKLLSQIMISYTDNGKTAIMNSYVESCLRGQITVKKIKNGVRVEYAMGRTETRKLLPMYIERSRFEELILANVPDDAKASDGKNAISKLKTYYILQDSFNPNAPETLINSMIASFPICAEMEIYTFDAEAPNREQTIIEDIIKTYCPEYTFETLEEDHNMTQYKGQSKAPALFRLSLEYMLDEHGNLDVRLPANGIRFDETTYQLNYIQLLPWFGAGSSEYEGYTFIPDGSGALVRFEDVGTKPLTITGKIYGQDYAYQKISGENKEVMRIPVYGVLESDVFIQEELTEEELAMGMKPIIPEYKQPNGFFAIIEEGDSLAELSTDHGGTTHKYNTVFPTFYPRPTDTYELDTAMTGGIGATYTVVSERKYTGSYRIKYIMLTDEAVAEAAGIEDYYEDSYVGMAKAYRDYLIENGTLTEMTDASEDIPLYIESFGAIDTIEKFLSIPIDVMKPLTTFDDLKSMYETLSDEGITNINFKLTGYTNGGMNSAYPYHVEFEKVVGGDKGFTEFVEYANENGIGVYPEFDFAYVTSKGMFDGVSNKKHLVKTMDNRYISKRFYDSTLQSFEKGMALVISPSVYDYFFDNFSEEYSALSPNGISVSTLGTDLNSDFDKKDPYNREDSREFTTDFLSDLEETYTNVMTEGGNAYALSYADHILNVPLDSSRFSRASESIPFMGMVLHGCVSFTGNAINMAGDTSYELLKAIENGSYLYFTLSTQNTSLLKEDEEFNKYYSVGFDIWHGDVLELYTELNEVLADLQDKQIIGHEFILGERVPTEEEAEADRIAAEEAAILAEEEAKLAAQKAEKAKLLAERLAALTGKEMIDEDDLSSGEDLGSDEVEEIETYNYTKYTSDDGKIVKVTYEGGTSFILNYNNFAITVVDGETTYTVEALGFVKVK